MRYGMRTMEGIYDLRHPSIRSSSLNITQAPTHLGRAALATNKFLAATGGHVREIKALVPVSAPATPIITMQALMACGSRYGGNEGARHALTLCSTPVVEHSSQDPTSQYHGKRAKKRQPKRLEGWTPGGHVLTPWTCHQEMIVWSRE